MDRSAATEHKRASFHTHLVECFVGLCFVKAVTVIVTISTNYYYSSSSGDVVVGYGLFLGGGGGGVFKAEINC